MRQSPFFISGLGENQTFFQVKMKDILYEMSITSENVTPKGS
jgi:hypothetical protein